LQALQIKHNYEIANLDTKSKLMQGPQTQAFEMQNVFSFFDQVCSENHRNVFKNWRNDRVLKRSLNDCLDVFTSLKIERNKKKIRVHPDLNQGPLDLQSNALPLSYTPAVPCLHKLTQHFFKKTNGYATLQYWHLPVQRQHVREFQPFDCPKYNNTVPQLAVAQQARKILDLECGEENQQ
jgi:hypothetical protein